LIIYACPAMRQLMALLDGVAASEAAVLVRGESGVGKELIVRELHARSRRSERPLVKVSCAGLDRERLIGAIGRAAGATLFLDEVGETPLELQPLLLHAPEADARLLAATHHDLAADLADGRFREDLYYRLAAVPLEVPPLRARREDLLPLATHFLERAAQQSGRAMPQLRPQHTRLLESHSWPGNVRELKHVLEHALVLSSDSSFELAAAMAPLSRRFPVH
jgi:transcriptional regulator with GAF, ATPase, and Fis domain